MLYVFLATIIFVVVLFIGKALIKEKYCYNAAFNSLDSKGIKLGKVNQGYSPLQLKTTPGSKEWEDAYLECRNNFDLSRVNISVLTKSYPNYAHFIDW